jgi:poly(A) polymerase
MIGLMNLLLEAAKEQLAVDFLRQQIKASRWQGKVYLAGGYVRDELMGLEPKDIDLVVDMPDGGIEFAKWLTRKLGIYSSSNPITYPKFGTAKLNLRGVKFKGVDLSAIDIEVVMPRTEKYTFGSRKPEVGAGTLAQDVERRDFTVNSLLKDLSTGEIKDFTGQGKRDIERGVIQTPLDPDIIFRDDPLRMLRAIRFTVKYNWKLPFFMIKGLKRNAHMLKHISAERIRDELDKMIVTGSPDKAIRLLQITTLSKYVMPELDLLIGLAQNKYHKWDANKHTLEVLKGTPPTVVTRLAALFHDIGKAETKEITDDAIHFYRHEEVGSTITRDIMKRLKYPNKIIDAVATAVGQHMRLKQAGAEGEIVSDKALRKLQADLGDHLEHTLDLMHADNIAHAPEHAMEKQIPAIRKRLKNLKAAPTSQNIPIPIDGNDVMTHLNIRPGPLVKVMLDVVKDAWFENPAISRQQALDLIEKTLKGMAK